RSWRNPKTRWLRSTRGGRSTGSHTIDIFVRVYMMAATSRVTQEAFHVDMAGAFHFLAYYSRDLGTGVSRDRAGGCHRSLRSGDTGRDRGSKEYRDRY